MKLEITSPITDTHNIFKKAEAMVGCVLWRPTEKAPSFKWSERDKQWYHSTYCGWGGETVDLSWYTVPEAEIVLQVYEALRMASNINNSFETCKTIAEILKAHSVRSQSQHPEEYKSVKL